MRSLTFSVRKEEGIAPRVAPSFATTTRTGDNFANRLAPFAFARLLTRRVLIFSALISILATVGCANGGGGSGSTETTTPQAAPVLTAAVVSPGNFSPGQTGATYSITVSNAANAGSTTGTTTVTDPPSGFTITGVSGSGWTCTVGTPAGGFTCTRTDSLRPGSSFPAIIVTGTVTATAGQTVSIPTSVSGGGLTTPANVNGSITVAAPVLSI